MAEKSCAFYAVRKGRTPGVYNSWSECEAEVKGFKCASYKKFRTKEQALDFVNQENPGAFSSGLQNNVSDVYSKRKHEEISLVNEDTTKIFKNENVVPMSPKYETGETVDVYTDGASSHNGYKGAQAGIGVYWGPGDSRNTSKRLSGRQTNNRAEIHAAIHALKQAKKDGVKNIKLHTDSQFLINGITSWIGKWKKNDWKLAGTDKSVKNKEDFIELDAAREGLNVDWVYVKGHDGHYGNVEADKLAVAGSTMPLEVSDI